MNRPMVARFPVAGGGLVGGGELTSEQKKMGMKPGMVSPYNENYGIPEQCVINACVLNDVDHVDGNHQCAQCEKIGNQKGHRSCQQLEPKLQCNRCPVTFKNERDFVKHQEWHWNLDVTRAGCFPLKFAHPSKPHYRCDLCVHESPLFKEHQGLVKHKSAEH